MHFSKTLSILVGRLSHPGLLCFMEFNYLSTDILSKSIQYIFPEIFTENYPGYHIMM